jgi:pyrroline-5-carboxylate reductase
VFLVAESLIEAGIHAGLSREVRRTLVGQTMMGAGRLLVESGQTAAELRQAVTSPNGTTEAGLRVLADAEIHLAFHAAVEAATLRSRELGQA